jgi:hypothetical protein
MAEEQKSRRSRHAATQKKKGPSAAQKAMAWIFFSILLLGSLALWGKELMAEFGS